MGNILIDSFSTIAKEMCMMYLDKEKEYSNITGVDVKGCDIRGFKDGIEHFFEIKSAMKDKNEKRKGTVMLTQLNKAILNKDNYHFILCRGYYGQNIDEWEFDILTVKEFLELCTLTTPILSYNYPKITHKETTRIANEKLINTMWEDFEKWKKVK